MRIDKQITMKIGLIPNMNILDSISEINKRDNYKDKIKKYFNNELDELELRIDWSKASRDYDLIPWADGISYRELWERVHVTNPYYQSNNLTSEPVALEIIVGFEKELNIDIDKWGRLQYDWICNQFSEENVLSAMLHIDSEDNPHCHFLIYNINKEGQLVSAPCFINNELNDNFISKYEKDMKKYGLDVNSRMARLKEIKDGSIIDDDYYLAKIDYYISQNPRTELDDVEFVYDAKKVLTDKISALSFEKQEAYLEELLEIFTGVEKRLMRQAQTGEITKEQFFNFVKTCLKKMGVEKDDEMGVMLERMEIATYGNHVLEPLIDDESISDIKVIAPDRIRVKRYGRRLTSNLSFKSYEDYWRFLEGVCIKNHTDMSAFNAVQNFTDKTSNNKFILRFNICTNFVNSVPYPYLHIRKINKHKYSIEDLMNYGMMDMKVASYLLDKVKNGRGMLFTGKGASGKTTLMNTLLEHISYNNSGLVIQENEELFTERHPDMMFQHVVTSRRAGEIQYDLKDLARNGLLTDLDYFIIGEIKGGEALYFLNAAYTGHKCMASCHGASATAAMNKLADYVKYESDYSKDECLKMLQAMEVVVFMKNFKVAEIAEIVGWDEDKHDLKYKMVYKCPAV